jgi:hypothetical protein
MSDLRAATITATGNLHPVGDGDTLVVGAGAKTATGSALVTAATTTGTNTGDQAVETLTNANITSVQAGEHLIFNGVKWVNGPATAGSSPAGRDYLPNDTTSAGIGGIDSLTPTPANEVEQTDSVTVNASTVGTEVIARYATDALGGTTLEGGVWVFETWSEVDNVADATRVIVGVKKLVAQTGMTVTVTAGGAVTITGGAPLVAGDASADITLATLLVTPSYTLEILTVGGGGTTGTVRVPGGYPGEAGLSFSLAYKLFQSQTDTLENTSPGPFFPETTQQPFAINPTDRLMVVYWATTDATTDRTITFLHSGTEHTSHISVPLLVRHNDLPGLQGGSSTERYHITQAQATVVGNTSGTNTGNQFTAIADQNLLGNIAGASQPAIPLTVAQVLTMLGGLGRKAGTFVNSGLSAGVLTVTHSFALSAPFPVLVAIFDNTSKQIIPDQVTGLTNSAAIDLTSYGTLSGTWGYLIIR